MAKNKNFEIPFSIEFPFSLLSEKKPFARAIVRSSISFTFELNYYNNKSAFHNLLHIIFKFKID